jgi:Ca-activated chloride channel family protein
MTFARPLALLGLLLVPLLILALVLARRRRARYAVRFTAVEVLARVTGASRWRYLPAALLLAALVVLVAGAAKPLARVPVPREQATVMLIIDVSGSMDAEDVSPTRLAAAREAAGRFLDRLPADFQVGLVTFASDAETLVQPTTDRVAVREALDSLTANGGTAMGEGLSQALDVVEAARRESGEQAQAAGGKAPTAVALLLSDGANSVGQDPMIQAERAGQLGVPVYTIALGTPSGVLRRPSPFGGSQFQPVPPDPESLARIADTTDGRFFEAPSSRNLNAVYENLGSRIGFRIEQREVTVAFAAAGLLLLVFAGALWSLRSARLP